MSRTAKCLRRFFNALLLFVVITMAGLTTFYIAAGVALHGNWDRVHTAMESGYDGFFND